MIAGNPHLIQLSANLDRSLHCCLMVHVGSSQGVGGGNFEVRTPQVASVPHDIRTSSPTWIASAHANGFN